MELRQRRYFVAVAEEGNISRAAKRIFLTPNDDSMGASVNLSRLSPAEAQETIAKVLASNAPQS